MKRIFSSLFCLLIAAAAFAQEEPSPTPSPSPSPSADPAAVKPKPARPDAVKAWQEKRYDEAVEICLSEIKETPGNRNSYIVLGWSLRDSGRFSEAFDYARLGIERSGANSELLKIAEFALVRLYTGLYNQGRYDEAAARIMQLVAFIPASTSLPAAYALLGEIHLKKGNYVYADIALSYALHANPAEVTWWVNAGTARERSGDPNGALAAFNAALKLSPDHQEAQRGRVRVLEKLSAAPSPSP